MDNRALVPVHEFVMEPLKRTVIGLLSGHHFPTIQRSMFADGDTPLMESALQRCSQVMQLTPERLYLDLGRLIADMPELTSAPMTRELQSWLASVPALVKSSGGLAESLRLKVACQNLDGPLRDRNAEMISNILHRAFAKAEANAPREVRGSVVVLEGDIQAYKAVRKLLVTTNSDALLVDPDAAGKLLADYAVLAPERVTVRLLADKARYKPSLVTGVQRWQQRFGGRRDLMVRLASAKSLHERLVILDDARAWILGAPFSDLAKRSHTALVRMRPEEEARKIAVYSEVWGEAEPLSARN